MINKDVYLDIGNKQIISIESITNNQIIFKIKELLFVSMFNLNESSDKKK